MYFVRFGEVCVRFAGKKWDKKDLPEDTSVIDYDNEDRWSLDDLERESRLTDFGGAGRNEDAHAAAVMELFRRKGGEDDCLRRDWDDVLTALEDAEYDVEEDRRPIIFPGDLSLPTRKLIHDVAKIEREELAFRKKHFGRKPDEDDEDAEKEYMKLDEKGWDAREALLDSDLGDEILDGYDPVEDMKTMAAQLFFLYSHSRMKAETEGGTPDEDLYYAGSNLYTHAAVEQIAEKRAAEDEPILEPDVVEAINELHPSFGALMATGAGDKFLEEMDESTLVFLKEKGYDITSLAGAKAAQKFLENAGPEDAFYTEGPVDNEMDRRIGEMRIQAMLRCVKLRIEKMIGGMK